jgi:hypothetical protein
MTAERVVFDAGREIRLRVGPLGRRGHDRNEHDRDRG